MKFFKIVSLLLFGASTIVDADVLWKPEEISFEIKQSHPLVGKGYVLELNQTLDSGEAGWKQSRIDIPESWKTAELEMKTGKVLIKTKEKTYYVDAKNKGKLSFAILDGGKKTDEQLILIWAKYASHT